MFISMYIHVSNIIHYSDIINPGFIQMICYSTLLYFSITIALRLLH